MLDAFTAVYKRHPKIRFKIIGSTSGSEKKYLDDYLNTHQLEGVVYETGWLAYSEVALALGPVKLA